MDPTAGLFAGWYLCEVAFLRTELARITPATNANHDRMQKANRVLKRWHTVMPLEADHTLHARMVLPPRPLPSAPVLNAQMSEMRSSRIMAMRVLRREQQKRRPRVKTEMMVRTD